MGYNANSGSKSNNMETNIKASDRVLGEVIMSKNLPETIKEASDEEIQDAVVYENGITSIDFLLPEEEKQILENNLNVFEDLEKTNKVLSIAQKNMFLRQKIKKIKNVDDLNSIIDKGNQKLIEMADDLMSTNAFFELAKTDPVGANKAFKEFGLTIKALTELRDNSVKDMSGNNNKKNAKIALKFTNDSGEEVSIGMEV